MSRPETRGLAHDIRVALKRSALSRHLEAVAAGTRETLGVDLGDAEVDLPASLDEAVGRLGAGTVEFQRIAMGLKRTGAYDTAVDQLGAADPVRRIRSARLAGALRMEQAVPWLAALLRAADEGTRQAAARALGRIGGTRAAEALLQAAGRRPHSPTLVISLANAAPDLFLEAAIRAPNGAGELESAAVAAGLRRRVASVGPLQDLLGSGDPRERAVARRALRSILRAEPSHQGAAA